ncbi:hypothetical protein [Actinoplanes sp. NPDC020271]|uniref:hypothetical protein n=1 Tax=Actinoplanes sp. NPDC020271 TaxID=3363896 RepID=UPI0037AD2A9B
MARPVPDDRLLAVFDRVGDHGAELPEVAQQHRGGSGSGDGEQDFRDGGGTDFVDEDDVVRPVVDDVERQMARSGSRWCVAGQA